MKNILSITFFLIALFSKAQSTFDDSNISSEVKSTVKTIAEGNLLTDEFIGYGGSKSEQYERFEKLKSAATQELVMLTNHPNGVVRCYAFWALGYRPDVDMFEIVKKHLDDNEIVRSQSGCLISSDKVGDFYINLVTPDYVDLHVKKLSETQRNILDSILIYRPNELNAKHKAIESAKPTPQLYPVLRNLYLTTHNQSALEKLSMYQREEDIPLILANREEHEGDESGYFSTYRAIRNFPRSEFIPFLEARLNETLDNTHFSNEWREMYSAIATYKNQKAVDLLTVPFSKVVSENIKPYHLDFIYEALLENYNPLYDVLLWGIWEEGNDITPEGYRFYLQNNLKRTYQKTLKYLYDGHAEVPANLTYNESIFNEKIFNELAYKSPEESVEEIMLNLVLLNDKPTAYQVVESKILKSGVLEFPIYIAVVKKDKDRVFIKPLFERLSKEHNAYVFLDIVETLVAFDDKSINDQILAMRRKNKHLKKDWGCDALTAFLKQHNIL